MVSMPVLRPMNPWNGAYDGVNDGTEKRPTTDVVEAVEMITRGVNHESAGMGDVAVVMRLSYNDMSEGCR